MYIHWCTNYWGKWKGSYFGSTFNEDSQGQESLLFRANKKFENKVVENVANKIAIDQVDLSTIIRSLATNMNKKKFIICKIEWYFKFHSWGRDQVEQNW